MSQPVKTPKNTYIVLAAGFGLGVVFTAGAINGTTPAYAQKPVVKMSLASGTSTESVAELHNLDASYTNLADFVSPAVVDIHAVTNAQRRGPNGERVPVSGGEGSGFIFRPDGYIITNDHVVGGFDDVKVTLKDGREYPGKVIRGEDSDLAIVKIEAKDLPVLALEDSSKIKTGQMVMAVGAPFGLQQSVTFGHISALGRESAIQDKLYPALIQTDASINMGNSGGPLVDIDGKVVGVNTSILSPSGVSAGIGFAIPSNQVKFIADMLINKGKLTKSMIGLVPSNLKDYEKADLKLSGGARVDEVSPGSPAATAGIEKGDIITKIGDTTITSQLDLRNAMLVYAPNTTVPVQFVRNGSTKTVQVKLTEYKKPQEPARNLQGGSGNGRGFTIPKGFGGEDFDKFFKDLPNNPFQRGGDDNNDDDTPVLPEGSPRLGISVGDLTDDSRTHFNVPKSATGAIVGIVSPNSVGAKIGLQQGDVITSFGGKKIETARDLTDAIQDVKWGDTKSVQFTRYTKSGSSSRTVDAKFGK